MDFLKSVFGKLRRYDYVLALIVIGISVFGVVLMASNPTPVFATQHRFHVSAGIALMLIVSFIDYRFIGKFYLPIYFLSIGLLFFTLAMGPDDFTQTSRWIRIEIADRDLSVQPSELAKLALIICASAYIHKRSNINHILWAPLYGLMVAIPILAVIGQRALSAASVLLIIGLVILFVGGLYYKIILPILFLFTPAAFLLYLDMQRQESIILVNFLTERQLERIQTFFAYSPDADARMQTELSLFAIGSGGLNGSGFMENEALLFHAHNDFIFALFGEQFGFIGSFILLTALFIIIIKCLYIAFRASDVLGRLIAAGVGSMILYETFVNIAVATDLLPNTGMPLPFLSYGGTTTWAHFICIGLALNISMNKRETLLEQEEAQVIDEMPAPRYV